MNLLWVLGVLYLNTFFGSGFPEELLMPKKYMLFVQGLLQSRVLKSQQPTSSRASLSTQGWERSLALIFWSPTSDGTFILYTPGL